MKVLVADKFEETGLAGLREAGCEVVYRPDISGPSLSTALRESEADVLVVRSTKVGAPEMDEGTRLALIVRAGAGVNTIDLEAASARAIAVSNCPGKNAIAVAEVAFGMILALDRRIVEQTRDLTLGVWNKSEYGKARGLAGQTLGVLGTGSIGREVIHRAHAFGMKVIAYSRSLSEGLARELSVTRAASIQQVAQTADGVSVHLALTSETRGLLETTFFEGMKKGAFFINTSRGEIVDEGALLAAVRDRGLRLGLDVFSHEPAGGAGSFTDPIAGFQGFVGTHHVGASTEQAQNAIADETVRIVKAFKNTGQAPSVVNLADRTPATHLLTVRHRDRVGVLAHVFSELKLAGINVGQAENVIFAGAAAASARIQMNREPGPDVLERIRKGCEDVLALSITVL